MNKLIPKIGLEIHLELSTQTKLFCSCLNNPEEKTNRNICPICTGQPGVLPVLNKEAVVYAYSLAKALKMNINKKSFFARKHYFYPDLPKNYQITQYEIPIAINGEIILVRENFVKKIRIRRIHLEEDTAANIHFKNFSAINFNRAGVPLIEIVTEPDINSAEEAEALAEDLVLLSRYLNISQASAEKGQIRFEANISLAEKDELGTKVEIKNIAKVQSLKKAILSEINRQEEVVKNGGQIIQETRGFDEIKNITFSQRSKEEEKDYRYFPEPDLPPLVINKEIEEEAIEIETPWDKRLRFLNQYGLDFYYINILTKDKFLAHFFEESLSELQGLIGDFNESKKLIINFLINDILGLSEKLKIDLSEEKINSHEFSHLLFKFFKKEISSKVVKEALEKALKQEQKIEEFIKNKEKISNVEILQKIIDEIILDNKKAVEDYLSGNLKSLEFLLGLIMRKTEGKADPQLVRQLLQDALKR